MKWITIINIRGLKFLNIPAGSSELQIGVPWISTSLLDHKDCNGGNCEVVG